MFYDVICTLARLQNMWTASLMRPSFPRDPLSPSIVRRLVGYSLFKVRFPSVTLVAYPHGHYPGRTRTRRPNEVLPHITAASIYISYNFL
ncbi:hypothetical protein SCLCIDRAFT_1221364 [Scleroderma citrinum Foug A]|uniref:Uncharacterized protein n=1 Tax=Scleroderma citrinum Foug A TaxID=1036808 RepID=A0A0C3D361_9AGAM|nr:hypothetical protein SCLCIDRAFT_1221364 [Scleroderma citrinum Foug A]